MAHVPTSCLGRDYSLIERMIESKVTKHDSPRNKFIHQIELVHRNYEQASTHNLIGWTKLSGIDACICTSYIESHATSKII